MPFEQLVLTFGRLSYHRRLGRCGLLAWGLPRLLAARSTRSGHLFSGWWRRDNDPVAYIALECVERLTTDRGVQLGDYLIDLLETLDALLELNLIHVAKDTGCVGRLRSAAATLKRRTSHQSRTVVA